MTSLVDFTGNMMFHERAAPLERQIIATLLDMPSKLAAVAEIIEAEDFISDPAKQVYAWLRAQKNGAYDVSPALAQSRFTGVSSVEAFLMMVMCELPSAAQITRHAEELRDLAARRDQINAIQQSLPELLQQNIPLESTLSKISAGVQRTTGKLNSNQSSIKSYAEVGVAWSEEFQERVMNGGVAGLETHFTGLDDMLAGLQPADLIIIAGRPSMGKTTFAMNIVENVAIKSKRGVLVFSLEMPMKQIYQRSLASVGGIDFEDLRKGQLKNGDEAKLQIAIRTLDGAPIYIDDEAGLTLPQLRSRAMRLAEEHDIGLIMIDYLQLMSVSEYAKSNLNLGFGEISKGLKQLAKALNIPVIALSQLNRSLEQRPNKRPINSDLRDSGSIEQDADVIMFVYRDVVYNPDTENPLAAEIIIGKQRNGPLGEVHLEFGGSQSSFRNPGVGTTPTTLKANNAKVEARRLGPLKGSDGVTEAQEKRQFPERFAPDLGLPIMSSADNPAPPDIPF
jgi:replicative DNA helicase